MKKYDVIVVGAGDAGLGIAFKAASDSLRVALIDKGSVGGTCINTGCVPSKTLIYAADRIIEIKEAAKLGIHAEVGSVSFREVMERMRTAVTSGRDGIRKAIEETENLDFFYQECRFLDEFSLEAGGEKIKGKKIFIASGSRPLVPVINGLDSVPFLTNESILDLSVRPESMIFIGGGYIGLEYAHFFSAFGTRVTIIDRASTLLPFEEPEISELLKTEIGRRVNLLLGVEIKEIRRANGGSAAVIRDARTNEEKEVFAESVLIATGRKSNADLLRAENAGIVKDAANFIKVDDYLQTNKKHVWALGDAIGKQMFTHAADKEAELAWHNANHRKKVKMDFLSVPHAVFTYPQIASVGLTEEQARKEHDVLIGRAMYSDTVMGDAMVEREGFAKAVVEKDTGRILGFHIMGPNASILIQEVVNAVANRGDVKSITGCMHIFPALSDLIPEALNNLE